MLTHVVLLKFTPATTREQLDLVAKSLRELPGEVESIRSYVVGADAGLAEGNAQIAVIATFDDAQGHADYTVHPAHRRVIEEQILPWLESRSATQFEGD